MFSGRFLNTHNVEWTRSKIKKNVNQNYFKFQQFIPFRKRQKNAILQKLDS